MKLLIALTTVIATALPFGAAAASVQDVQAVQPTSNPVPTLIRFDGALTAPTGEPRSGNVALVVSLYADNVDPNPLWQEQQLVTLDQAGRYTLSIGSTLPGGLPIELFGGNSPRWLGVAVLGEAEQPRMMLLSVPYAIKAGDADTVAGKSAADFVLAQNLAESVKSALTPEDFRAMGAEGSNPGVATVNFIPRYSDGGGVNTADSIMEQVTTSAIKLGGSLSVGVPTFVPLNLFELSTNNGADRIGLTSGPGLGYIGGFAASTNLSIYAGNAERARLSTTGNFGIGTSTPASRLSVNGGAAIGTYASGVAAPANGLIISGAVGIGVTAPVNLLELSTNAGVDRLGLTAGPGIGYIGGFTAGTALSVYAGNGEKIRISAAGDVGIGTSSPTAKLHVAGNVNVDGNIGAKYQDVAEWVDTPSPLDAGMVVVVDPTSPNRVVPAARAYDTTVAGAVSAQPGLILGEWGDGKAMVAQSGRVRIKADASYGAIKIGDLLVTSPTPGHAMVSKPMKVGGQSFHRPGTLLGKALEALPNGKGEILVLLTLQ